MMTSMQPNGKHTPAAVPKLPCFLLIFSASLARSAQAAALAPQLAVVALAKGTTLALLTCKGTIYHVPLFTCSKLNHYMCGAQNKPVRRELTCIACT